MENPHTIDLIEFVQSFFADSTPSDQKAHRRSFGRTPAPAREIEMSA